MGINVLSLCDGMACARIALDRCDIPVDNYFAAEIKQHAIKCATENWPDIIEIGDVNKISYSNGILFTENNQYDIDHVDLVCFGSPCQSFSIAMKTDKRIGLEDLKRSGLFYECNRILQEVNPTYFFVENVASMKKQDRDILSSYLGCEPIKIDSEIVAPAMRKRYYWTNLKHTPLKKNNKTLSSILERGYTEREKARALLASNTLGGYTDMAKRFRRYYDKGFGTIIFKDKENYEKCCSLYQKYKGTSAKDFEQQIVNDIEFKEACNLTRLPTQHELEDCQNVPRDYTKMLSYNEAANLLGDGWTIDVICSFFENL